MTKSLLRFEIHKCWLHEHLVITFIVCDCVCIIIYNKYFSLFTFVFYDSMYSLYFFNVSWFYFPVILVFSVKLFCSKIWKALLKWSLCTRADCEHFIKFLTWNFSCHPLLLSSVLNVALWVHYLYRNKSCGAGNLIRVPGPLSDKHWWISRCEASPVRCEKALLCQPLTPHCGWVTGRIMRNMEPRAAAGEKEEQRPELSPRSGTELTLKKRWTQSHTVFTPL